jgi:hypothetical protein
MGALIAKALDKMFGEGSPKRLVIIGLDGAGKTKILYNLRLGKLVNLYEKPL